MRFFLIGIISIFLFEAFQNRVNNSFNNIAIEYLKIGLTTCYYYPDIKAYYVGGPDSITAFSAVPGGGHKSILPSIPKDSLIVTIDRMMNRLNSITGDYLTDDTVRMRSKWMASQLMAFKAQILIQNGAIMSFDEESILSYGMQAPIINEEYFKSSLAELEKILPGNGTVRERYLNLSQKFNLPKEKTDTVFRTVFSEVRKRTGEKLRIPENETIIIKYVNSAAWEAGCSYKGRNTSVVQIDTTFPINICRAIDIACHEGYPGHHVYNMIMEKNLNNNGWVELSLRPMFSAYTFISEGLANYGITLTFPGDEYNKYVKEVLLPLCSLDTTNIEIYFKARAIIEKMSCVTNEIARGVIDGTMSTEETENWQLNYCFFTGEQAKRHINVIQEQRIQVISYSYGADLTEAYIKSKCNQSSSIRTEWEIYRDMLDGLLTPDELLN